MDGALLGVSTIEFLPDPEVVKSFYKSEGLSVRFHAPNGEWSRSHDYALTGATEPLKAAELACKRELAQQCSAQGRAAHGDAGRQNVILPLIRPQPRASLVRGWRAVRGLESSGDLNQVLVTRLART